MTLFLSVSSCNEEAELWPVCRKHCGFLSVLWEIINLFLDVGTLLLVAGLGTEIHDEQGSFVLLFLLFILSLFCTILHLFKFKLLIYTCVQPILLNLFFSILMQIKMQL